MARSEFVKKYNIKNNKINADELEKYNIIEPRKDTKYRELFDDIIKIQKEYKYEIMSESIQKTI